MREEPSKYTLVEFTNGEGVEFHNTLTNVFSVEFKGGFVIISNNRVEQNAFPAHTVKAVYRTKDGRKHIGI